MTKKGLNELFKKYNNYCIFNIYIKKRKIGVFQNFNKNEENLNYSYHLTTNSIFRVFVYFKIHLLTAIFSGICFFSLFFLKIEGFIDSETIWTCSIFILSLPIVCETIVLALESGNFFILFQAIIFINFILGFKKFVRSFFNLFEIITSVSLLILCIVYLGGGCSIKIVEIFTIFRFFRFFVMLLNFHYLRSVFESFLGCLPLFIDLFSVLIVLYFIFATFGMFFFGGLLNEKVDLIFNGASYSSVYYSSNFNDLPNSFLILFSLMIVNNWNNQVILFFYYF